MNYLPANDGVDHINIYSRGKTELGKLLSNFARTEFQLPDDGKFASVEGYWYWLITGKEHFRNLSGYYAKQLGKQIREELLLANAHDERFDTSSIQFQNKIKVALKAKLDQTPYLQFLMLDSALPFTHYYVFNGIKKQAGFEWIVETWEQLRTQLKENSTGEQR